MSGQRHYSRSPPRGSSQGEESLTSLSSHGQQSLSGQESLYGQPAYMAPPASLSTSTIAVGEHSTQPVAVSQKPPGITIAPSTPHLSRRVARGPPSNSIRNPEPPSRAEHHDDLSSSEPMLETLMSTGVWRTRSVDSPARKPLRPLILQHANTASPNWSLEADGQENRAPPRRRVQLSHTGTVRRIGQRRVPGRHDRR
jgi:hypothetical protein